MPIGTEYEVTADGTENRCLVWEGSVRIEGQTRQVKVTSNAQIDLTADLSVQPYPLSKRRHLAESQNLTESVSLPEETRTRLSATPEPIASPSLPAPAYPQSEATAAPPVPNVRATANKAPSPHQLRKPGVPWGLRQLAPEVRVGLAARAIQASTVAIRRAPAAKIRPAFRRATQIQGDFTVRAAQGDPLGLARQGAAAEAIARVCRSKAHSLHFQSHG